MPAMLPPGPLPHLPCSYLVMAVLVPPDCHVGSKMVSSCMILGATLVSCVFGGAVVSICDTCVTASWY